MLIVDDSPAQRRMLAVQLGRAGFRVINAANGAEAVALFAQKRPDIVVSDWVMPGMSGPDLCRALRAAQGDDYLYFILLTSRAEKNAVAYGLEAGADDFMAKPVASAELLARMRAGARIVRLQAQQRDSRARLQLALDELRLAQSAIERDLAEARQLQHALTGERQRRFGDFSVSSLLQSAGQIGGDLVGMFPVNPRCFGFYAIDVSGHGVVAALLTARLAAQLSPSLDQNAALRMNEWGLYDARAPVELAEYLNHLMLADFRIDSYFTLV
ncbi:MAG: response regulator, partial [Paracoccus sp. (in: a-proteobacteria)]|nr:response regulator [Paracoccus sp. (in: a-proteobacteria)]